MPQYAVSFHHNHKDCVAIIHDQTPKDAVAAIRSALGYAVDMDAVELTDKHFVIYRDAELVKRVPGNPEDILRQRESLKGLGTPEKP
jgi:hypothetical protein